MAILIPNHQIFHPAVFILSITEANGLRYGKRYLWTTLALYEFVALLSFVAYIDVLKDVWTLEEGGPLKIDQNTRFEFYQYILVYMLNWAMYCSLWIGVSDAHIVIIVRNSNVNYSSTHYSH